MRDFLDDILAFIGSESLTDQEYASTATLGLTQEYSIKTYNALKTILTQREEVSLQLDKLKWFFQVKGVTIDTSAKTPKSNIFIGGSLDDVSIYIPTAVDPDPSPTPTPGDAITALSGEVTAQGPGAVNAVISNSAVILKTLSGFVASAGSVSAADNIRAAFQKVVGNATALASTVGGFAASIAGLESDVSDIETDVSTLQGGYTTLSGQVSTAQGDITDLEGDVSTLQTSVGTAQGNITTLQSDVLLKAPKDSPSFSTKATFGWATAGMMAIFNGSKELVSLAAGTNTYVLTMVAGAPAWAAAAVGLTVSGSDNQIVRMDGTGAIQSSQVKVNDAASSSVCIEAVSGNSLCISPNGPQTSPGGTNGWVDFFLGAGARMRVVNDGYSSSIGTVEWSAARILHRIAITFVDGSAPIGKNGATFERPSEVWSANYIGVANTSTTATASTALEVGGTTGAVLFPRMTGTQRDALTATNGMVIYNSSTDKLQARAAGAWVDLH